MPGHPSSLGRTRGLAIYLSALMGAGLLVMPALTYQLAGPASVIAWAGLLALSVPVAFTFARLGAEASDAAGVGAFVTRAFGRKAGDAVGFIFVFALPLGAPSAALVGAAYLVRATGAGQQAVAWAAAGLLLSAIASAALGLRVSGTVQVVLVLVLLVVLLIACAGAVPYMSTDSLQPAVPHGLSGISAAMGLLFFTFAGWEAVAPLAREFDDPDKDVRVVTSAALAITTVLYLGLATASVLALGPGLARTDTPVEALLSFSIGGAAAPVTGVLAAALTYGAMTSYVGGAGRMMAAIARDGRLPGYLAAGVARGETPRRAVTLIGVLAMATLAVTSTFGLELATLMNLASAMFIAVTAAGLAAGSRLLVGRWSRWLAAATCLTLLVVLAGCGWAVTYPLVVTALAWSIPMRRSPTCPASLSSEVPATSVGGSSTVCCRTAPTSPWSPADSPATRSETL